MCGGGGGRQRAQHWLELPWHNYWKPPWGAGMEKKGGLARRRALLSSREDMPQYTRSRAGSVFEVPTREGP